jgi:acetyl/propionyl-CoA carboxylase alpha subunit
VHQRAMSNFALWNACSVRPSRDLKVCWFAKSLAYSQATYGGPIWSVVLLAPCPSGDPLLHQSSTIDVTGELPLGRRGGDFSRRSSKAKAQIHAYRSRRHCRSWCGDRAVAVAHRRFARPRGLVVTTEVVKVTTGTIKQTVATSGTLEPATQASLDFAVSGTVTAVDVKAGQKVTDGQVLATVGTTALQADVDSAQAQLASAQARLSSDESSSAATTQIDSDEASVTSAESSLTSANTSLADASLTSTISGTVASVSLTVGEQVTGSGRWSRAPAAALRPFECVRIECRFE